MTMAMQAVSSRPQGGPKVLRIGVIQGDKMVEERIIRRREVSVDFSVTGADSASDVDWRERGRRRQKQEQVLAVVAEASTAVKSLFSIATLAPSMVWPVAIEKTVVCSRPSALFHSTPRSVSWMSACAPGRFWPASVPASGWPSTARPSSSSSN
jgi:hypothetical protein